MQKSKYGKKGNLYYFSGMSARWTVDGLLDPAFSVGATIKFVDLTVRRVWVELGSASVSPLVMEETVDTSVKAESLLFSL